jgi:hypothetical protein
VHKGCDILDWMKETHPNILVILIPTNYKSLHSKYNSTLGLIQPSNNKLKTTKIHRLISK